MTSKPLFIKVEESIVIFRPMAQFGCLRALATVTDRVPTAVATEDGGKGEYAA